MGEKIESDEEFRASLRRAAEILRADEEFRASQGGTMTEETKITITVTLPCEHEDFARSIATDLHETVHRAMTIAHKTANIRSSTTVEVSKT